MPDTPEGLRRLEGQLRELEEELAESERKKAAGGGLSNIEAGKFGKLPEMIAAKKTEIAGALHGLGWDD
jgi:hypothetical protein